MLITQRKFATIERFRKKVEDYIVEGEETQPGGKLTVSMGRLACCLEIKDKTILLEKLIKDYTNLNGVLYINTKCKASQSTLNRFLQ